MREQISRLMDDDLDGAEAEAAFRELKRVDGLEYWTCCHIIGDALRRSGAPTAGFAQRFARRLDAEPTVLAPRPAQASRLPAIAKAREANSVRTAQRSQPVSPDYLIAHQEYSPTTQIQGVGPYLRAVSAGGVDGRP